LNLLKSNSLIPNGENLANKLQTARKIVADPNQIPPSEKNSIFQTINIDCNLHQKIEFEHFDCQYIWFLNEANLEIKTILSRHLSWI
jgi:archaellum component FlaG (FlaF/FlaG flagellin family)